MSEALLEVTDQNFDAEVLNSAKTVLVDFWAPWCGPCRAIAPVIEELAGEWAGTVVVGKCNVDDNPVTPGKFGIRAIPTLIIFKNGAVAEQITGLVQKGKIKDAVEAANSK
jgi:thioredoxin 1